jgi:hypothetical protein
MYVEVYVISNTDNEWWFEMARVYLGVVCKTPKNGAPIILVQKLISTVVIGIGIIVSYRKRDYEHISYQVMFIIPIEST